MMQMKDWVSLLVGGVIFLMGFLPLWFKMHFLPVVLFSYVASAAGFYLMIESVIEITNSNVIGWWSFIIAVIVLAIGVPPMLHSFNIGPEWFNFKWIGETVYHIIFMIEGVFLMIACFAMEL